MVTPREIIPVEDPAATQLLPQLKVPDERWMDHADAPVDPALAVAETFIGPSVVPPMADTVPPEIAPGSLVRSGSGPWVWVGVVVVFLVVLGIGFWAIAPR
jgi:hypothetical protein